MTRDTFDQFSEPERGPFGDNEMDDRSSTTVTGASDLKDFDLILHNDNPKKKAIAVSKRGDTPFENWIWLPRSLIECEPLGSNNHGDRCVRVTMPKRVAAEKGLL